MKKKFNDYQLTDLFHHESLKELDESFLKSLEIHDAAIHHQLIHYREYSQQFSAIQVSQLLMDCATHLETFLADFFDIHSEVLGLSSSVRHHDPIFHFKEWFVIKQARRKVSKINEIHPYDQVDSWLWVQLDDLADPELSVAKFAVSLLDNVDKNADKIDQLTSWCAHSLCHPEAIKKVASWQSFKLPKKLDFSQLVDLHPVSNDPFSRVEGPQDHFRHRDGFNLTDERMSQREVQNEVNYCVYCHKNEGDFCSKGFPVKKGEPDLGLKTNPLGEILTGCPLEEKISEMNTLQKYGHTLAALAVAMIDNPMIAATGHRICNDCMKGCVYQKQEPVNIPQIETRVLVDVLNLRWGVEILDLLTRWNPLKHRQYLPKPYNGLKVMVMGMGPAGFTLAHYLCMEGFAVVGVDGLKIEPLPEEFLTKPIKNFSDISEDLSTRVMTGFGGVAEYGITVRWDKNFLKLIYINLMRRPYFSVYGGVRFGGTITIEDVWSLGFDHLAIAVGAGLPRELAIPGSMAPGMRQANDFLMALQLTGAAKKSSLANLQVRMPAVVIGGGLTGIDTATELQAYYILQVEKVLERYEKLSSVFGESRVHKQFPDLEFHILNEFLEHGRLVRQERELAKKENRAPNFMALIRSWGGVTVVYRRRLQDSPAYKRNHEEVIKALEEGIYYAEQLDPVAARLDKYGYVESLVCVETRCDENGKSEKTNKEIVIPAKAILVATGAKPNIAYEFEHRGTFQREGMDYKAYEDYEGQLEVVHPDTHVKTQHFGPFTSYDHDGYRVSFLGDTHPVFHGSVVKAISSAKRIYPKIVNSFKNKKGQVGNSTEYQLFSNHIRDLFTATIMRITRHTKSVVELVVKAPMAVRNFQPGQFYRVQNFERNAKIVEGTLLQSEAIAMLGAQVDKEAGLLSLMVLENGASSRLFATLEEGSPISVMGPTGVRAKIPHDHENIMYIGGRMGAAHIRAVGPVLRAAGNKVFYVAGFRTRDEVYCQNELEAAADVILWVVETGEPIQARRAQDHSVTGEIMEELLKYARQGMINLLEITRVQIVGTNKLVKMVQKARNTTLKDYFNKETNFTASVYGPMQCMLKGVCAQCLQWQIDPLTGKRTKAVYACSWHDQPLDIIDINNLDDRLAQNRTQEILSNIWLDYLFSTLSH